MDIQKATRLFSRKLAKRGLVPFLCTVEGGKIKLYVEPDADTGNIRKQWYGFEVVVKKTGSPKLQKSRK